MHARVIIPPDPIVEPAEIAGSHAEDDLAVLRMIAAATRTIDGPNGWLGRALGKQTLELVGCHWHARSVRLPYSPIIQVVSVKYLDTAGAEQTVDPAFYGLARDLLWFKPAFTAPTLGCFPDPIRVRYEAGYDATPVEDGGTGNVPDEAKQAIIVMVQHMKAVGAENLFLRSEEVEGVGTLSYTVSDQADALVKRTVDHLLSGLRVYSL